MTGDQGFYIHALTLTGPGKADAKLEFADGLNVVSGASDTGKSYALSCIDFAFGASKPPSPIPEAAGYGSVVLSVIVRKTKEKYIFERGLAGGDVKFSRYTAEGVLVEENVLSARHSPTDPNTLSGVLLGLSDLYGKQVRKNQRGTRRTLSFRDVAYLALVDEERIIAKRPPQISGSPVEKTVESEVFRLLVTGDESGVVHSVPSTKQAVGVEAKLELIGSMVTEAEVRLSATGVNRETLAAELTAMESLRGTALNEYENARLEIATLEAALAKEAQMMRQTRARQQVVNGLTNRFTLLDQHYLADTARLHAIEESGKLLESLPSKPCPVCGAGPEQHSPSEQFQPEEVEASARAEAIKIGELRRDLEKVLGELTRENAELELQARQAKAELERIQLTVQNELMPRVKESAATLQAQNARRDLLIQAKNILLQLEELKAHETDLAAAVTLPMSSSTVVTTRPTTGDMDSFAASVQKILEAWNFPSIGRVVFSEDDQDLVISGQPRISHGKGVRALTCAAFVVGLLHHCRTKQLPHPSVVLLDSPLVAYREPDSASESEEDQKLRRSGVKEAFYLSLARGDAKGQVIVFENEDPPEGMKEAFTRTHFSKSSSGRYGLFAK